MDTTSVYLADRVSATKPLSASNSVNSFFLKMLLREHKVRENWLGKNRTLIIAL